MIATIIHIWVKPEYHDAFIKASIENHKGSVMEEGNLRFDILQDANDPNQFVYYEAYESEEAVKKHKESPHYQKWRDAVSDWMEKPREGIKHKIIAPLEKSLW
jgi:(4S)-4-hydroxy-5-phosphonooxypentane-2,3-dione isomerase